MSDNAAHNILELIQGNKHDFLVISSGYPKIGPFHRSHFVSRLASYATCPVLMLTTPVSKVNGKFNILFATDGSEASLTAARKLPELMDTQNMEVSLVTVQESYYIDNPVIAPYVNLPYLDQALANNEALILEATKSVLEASGVKVTSTLGFNGSPTYLLRDRIQKTRPDLVVVGSHNKKAVEAWFLGSVSSQLIHWSGANLLVVR